MSARPAPTLSTDELAEIAARHKCDVCMLRQALASEEPSHE